MNILKKKMGLDRPGPVIDLELVQIVWKDLQEHASAEFSELIPVARFRAAPIEVSSFGRKKLTDQFAQGAILSCFGSEPDQTEMIIATSPKTSLAISAGSFSTSAQGFSRTLLESLNETSEDKDASGIGDETGEGSDKAVDGAGTEKSITDVAAADPLVQALFKDYTKALNQTLSDLYNWPETCEFAAITRDADQIFLNEDKPRWVKMTYAYEIDLEDQSLTLNSNKDSDDGSKAKTEPNPSFALDVSICISAHVFDRIMADSVPDIQVCAQPDITEIIETAQIAKSNTPLRAVLEDLVLSVADCTRLHIGQVIALPGTSIRAVRVEAELGPQIRHPVALATLGIYKSKKALKINGSVDTDFLIRPKP